MIDRQVKAIEEVSRAGQRRAATPHERTGKLIGGQWYTLVHEEPAATTVPPKALLDRFASIGFPVHAELEKATIPGPPRREKIERVREVRFRGPNGTEIKEVSDVVEIEHPTTRQVKVWRVYVKIPAWEIDRDWASVANEEWVLENSGD